MKPTEFLINEKLVGSVFSFFAYFEMKTFRIFLSIIDRIVATEAVTITNIEYLTASLSMMDDMFVIVLIG